MHDHRAITHLEIKPIILRPEPIQHAPIAVDLPEAIPIQIFQILFSHSEFLKQLKLIKSPKSRNFRRADFVKNYLKHRRKLEGRRRICQRRVRVLSLGFSGSAFSIGV